MTHRKTATRFPARRLAAAIVASLLLACGGQSGKARSHTESGVNRRLSQLASRSDKAQSFMAESRMEYWSHGQRIKATVLVMGQHGARVRLNALSPTGGNVAADLACNGDTFQFIDFDKNCQVTGPCTKDSIGQLLRVRLSPDDFLLIAVGSTPLIDAPTGTATWDSAKRREVLNLVSGDGRWKQTIVLDGRNESLDVLSSTVWNSKGKVEWKLTHKDFVNLRGEDEHVFRVPTRTRFEQPQAQADVSIRWIERALNAEISVGKFAMVMPPLPRC